MMGVSFDPAKPDPYRQSSGPNATSQPSGGGIQEAIKILSLRLPKVVGAQAVSPQALLSSPGGSGSRVDSVVNQVLQKFFPQAAMNPMPMSAPMAPSMPNGVPSWSPAPSPSAPAPSPVGMRPRKEQTAVDFQSPFRPKPPHIVVDQPTIDQGHKPYDNGTGTPPGSIAPPPPLPWAFESYEPPPSLFREPEF